MIALILFLESLTLTLTAKPVRQPQITNFTNQEYTIVNPMLYGVEVVIDCGSKYMSLNAKLSPRTSQKFRITTPDGDLALGCFVTDWWRVK